MTQENCKRNYDHFQTYKHRKMSHGASRPVVMKVVVGFMSMVSCRVLFLERLRQCAHNRKPVVRNTQNIFICSL